MRMRMYSFLLPAELLIELKELASKQNTSVSFLLRQAINNFLHKQ